MNPSEIFYKGAAKNEPFGFFSSKGAVQTLRGQNPAILREGGGGRIKMEQPIMQPYPV